MINHPNRSKWLPGTMGNQFIQFSRARITRSRDPKGEYLYRTTSTPEGDTLYFGYDYEEANTKAKKAGE